MLSVFLSCGLLVASGLVPPGQDGLLSFAGSQISRENEASELISSENVSRRRSQTHLGDLMGRSLETDVSLVTLSNISFTPMQRVALTANGNFQRILSSYHNSAVKVLVRKNVRVRPGL